MNIVVTDPIERLRQTLHEPVVFVGVDPNYAVGPEAWLRDYSAACRHETAALSLLEARGLEVFCLEREVGPHNLPGRATAGVLTHPSLVAWMARKSSPAWMLVFKPDAAVEAAAAVHGWRILGARAAVARPMENKVNFFRLLDELALPHPPWREVDLATESYAQVARDLGPRFVLQAAHGFSGNRTFPVDAPADFERASGLLARRRVRGSARVEGLPVTMNACVEADGRVRTAPLFYQITGAPECTAYPMGACGNDWAAPPPHDEAVDQARGIARSVGRALAGRGFRGIFGLDFVLTPEGRVSTIECNPRLVSSVPMASALEVEAGAVPLLVSHLLATSEEGALVPSRAVPSRAVPSPSRAGTSLHASAHAVPSASALALSQAVVSAASPVSTKPGDALPAEDIRASLRGAQMVLHALGQSADAGPRRVAGGCLRATHRLEAGMYRLAGDGVAFQRHALRVTECCDESEFLVLPPSPGHVFAPASECARVQTRRSLIDLSTGRLDAWGRSVARAVYRALALEPCESAESDGV